MTTVRIERNPTLTPIGGCLSPGHGLLCVELVDRRLEDLIRLGEDKWSLPRPFYTITAATTAIPSTRTTISPYTSPITTATPPLPSEKGNTKDKRRPGLNGIASRLPVRSQATIHRRPHPAIARNLLPRTANRATYNRNRPWANRNPATWLRA